MDRTCIASYIARIGISHDPASLPANEKTLRLLMAAHNRHVPFEVFLSQIILQHCTCNVLISQSHIFFSVFVFENIDVVFNRTIETVLPKLHAKIVGRKRFVITHANPTQYHLHQLMCHLCNPKP